MTPSFANNIQKWKDTLGTKYSIYIHDDDSVNKFIYEKKWLEFPEFPEIMSCVTAGVSLVVGFAFVCSYDVCTCNVFLSLHLLILCKHKTNTGSKSRYMAIYNDMGVWRNL